MWQWISGQPQFCKKEQMTSTCLIMGQSWWLVYMDNSSPFQKRCLHQTTPWMVSKAQKSQSWIFCCTKLKTGSPATVFLALESCYELFWSVYLFQNSSSYMIYSQQSWQSRGLSQLFSAWLEIPCCCLVGMLVGHENHSHLSFEVACFDQLIRFGRILCVLVHMYVFDSKNAWRSL